MGPVVCISVPVEYGCLNVWRENLPQKDEQRHTRKQLVLLLGGEVHTEGDYARDGRQGGEADDPHLDDQHHHRQHDSPKLGTRK